MKAVKMEYIDRANILVEVTQEHFNDKDWEEFFDYNDLGIPLAIALVQDLVILTDEGGELLYETWADLCDRFNIDPDLDYDSYEEVKGKGCC